MTKMDKRLIAAHVSQWLPLLGFFLFSNLPGGAEAGPGVLQYLPLILIPAGWLLMPVVSVWNLLHALRVLTAGKSDPAVFRTAMRHKLIALPCFIITFWFWLAPAAAAMGMANPWMFWMIPFAVGLTAPLVALSVFSTWLATLATSGYVIAQVVLLWRNKTITSRQCAAHLALQLVFVADLLGCLNLRAWFATPSPGRNQSSAASAEDPAASSLPPRP